MCAQAILTLMKKIIMTKKPTQLNLQIEMRKGRTGTIWRTKKFSRLSITSSNFIYKGIALWNKLDPDIRETKNTVNFKKKIIDWVKANIAIKPG